MRGAALIALCAAAARADGDPFGREKSGCWNGSEGSDAGKYRLVVKLQKEWSPLRNLKYAAVRIPRNTGFAPVQAEPDLLDQNIVLMEPSDGCRPLRNAGVLEGKVALVARGSCDLAVTEHAGATGVIVVNNDIDGGCIASESGLPIFMISFEDGWILSILMEEYEGSLSVSSENSLSEGSLSASSAKISQMPPREDVVLLMVQKNLEGKIGATFKGTSVVYVEKGGAAEAAGMRVGMVVVSLAGAPIRTEWDLTDVEVPRGADGHFSVVVERSQWKVGDEVRMRDANSSTGFQWFDGVVEEVVDGKPKVRFSMLEDRKAWFFDEVCRKNEATLQQSPEGKEGKAEWKQEQKEDKEQDIVILYEIGNSTWRNARELAQTI